MKKLSILVLTVPLLLLAGCDDAKKAGDETAREVTGANMIEQGRKAQQKLEAIDRQQRERYERIEGE